MSYKMEIDFENENDRNITVDVLTKLCSETGEFPCAVINKALRAYIIFRENEEALL